MGVEVQAMVRDEAIKYIKLKIPQNKAIKATGDNAGLVFAKTGCASALSLSLGLNKY
jgi:hypothetical protein